MSRPHWMNDEEWSEYTMTEEYRYEMTHEDEPPEYDDYDMAYADFLAEQGDYDDVDAMFDEWDNFYD